MVTKEHGLVLIEPIQKTYDSHLCLAGKGVGQVRLDLPFGIVIVNFGDSPKKLLKNKRVATVQPHPTAVVESNITHAELVGLNMEETSKDDTVHAESKDKQSYKKRHMNARDAEIINRNLSYFRIYENLIRKMMRRR